MQYFSQRDPSYDRLPLGKSRLTIGGYGCFLVSMANLYQRNPVDLLDTPGGVTDSGLLVSSVIAKECGGMALPATKIPPDGWSIAMTSKYAAQGVPTHFFCVNFKTKQQIDPLDFPAKIEPLSYPIIEYRPFTNIKLLSVPITPLPFPDVNTNADAIRFVKERGLMNGFPDGTFRPNDLVTREQLAVVLQRLV